MTDSIPFDHQAIRYHCQLLHHFAAGCDGTLVVAAFSADTEENEIRHFPVGQYEAMADFIISFEARPEPINIYTSASVLKLGVSIYSKGKNEDVAAVFAVVVDGDADKDGDSAAMPPVPAHYIVESSPGNRQHYLFLDELIPPDEAAPLLESWHAAVGGDSAAKNLCGLWRCPGTVNHPIESKRKRGRVIAPSSIAQYWNEQRISSRKLRALLPSPPAPPERRHQDPRIGKVPHYEFLDVVALGLFLDQQGVIEEYGDQEAGWLTFGMACVHDQGEDEGRRIWASVHDDTVTEATIKTKLRSFKGDDNPVTLATFMKLAHKKGWTGRLRENLNWTYYFILNGTYQPPEIKPWPEGVPFIGPSPGVWEDHQDEPAPRPHLRTRLIKASALAGLPVPERQWLIDGLVPMANNTLLYGDGGVGKSLVAIQKGACVVTGQQFFGRMVTQGKVVFVTAEDDQDEMHRRLAKVAPLEALDNFQFISLTDEDAFLALPTDGRRGVLEATPLYAELAEILNDERPALLVLDTLADVFGGDEVVRAQARAFVALLRRLAIQFGQANLVLAHPSLSGMATGTGTSGSTGWNNSVRSRLYFDYVRDEKRNVLDRDLRVLRTMKANYAATGQEIFMRYSDGRFLPEAMENHDPIIQRAKARLVFLRLLKKCIEQKRPVGPKPGSNYAPAIFAGDEGAERFKTKDLAKAMNELLTENKIRIDEWGPPSRRVSHLAICPGVTFDDDHGEGA